MTTAYDAVTARIADPVVDLILVGDSVGNVCLGFDDTLPVSMAMMNHHLEAVARTRPRAMLVADMPFLSFHLSPDDTIRNAGGFLQRGADAVKLEGGGKRVEMIRALVNCEIPVMGHLGLTPQSVNAMGGFKVQGRNADDALRLLEDAHQLQQAGCFALVLEGIPAELAARATESLTIPTIGIGAGPSCSGQVLVFHDVLGLARGHYPKFVRVYVEGHQLLQEGLSRWAADVRSGAFPAAQESYRIPDGLRGPIVDWTPSKAELVQGPTYKRASMVGELRGAIAEERQSDNEAGFAATIRWSHRSSSSPWPQARRPPLSPLVSAFLAPAPVETKRGLGRSSGDFPVRSRAAKRVGFVSAPDPGRLVRLYLRPRRTGEPAKPLHACIFAALQSACASCSIVQPVSHALEKRVQQRAGGSKLTARRLVQRS
ncbi:3-methyl-2-oxobutanoate hydroxymethyltransferase [Bradyrhizobium sp. F1.13.4]